MSTARPRDVDDLAESLLDSDELQAHIDEIEQKITDWDDEVCVPGCGDPSGKDTKALWAAIYGFEKLQRSQGKGEITRWFAAWVRNRLVAEINTID